ncbi:MULTISPECIES: hypothetical protein [unclassified Haloarcula]|uniref:hypothetical protein n=1 Tax=unclassified Haloarcula TaxID=2624677 RepID=UPI000ACE8A39|nr:MULTISPECIES: hypothetical protein [unclassified Haloarcula]
MLFQKIKSLILNEGDQYEGKVDNEPVNSQMGASLADLKSSMSELSTHQVEAVFEEMPHETRIEFVYRPAITRNCWRKFYIYINNQEEEKWGLDSKYIQVAQGGTRQCIIHESIAEPRTLKRNQTKSIARSQSSSESIKGGITGDAKVIKGDIEGSETNKEKQTTKQGEDVGAERKIWECATLDKDCRANRRAFIKSGEYYMGGGPVNAEDLEREFERVVKKALSDDDETETEAV